MDTITTFLQLAGRHNGRIIGDYLRTVIIPLELDPTTPVQTCNITVWFDDTDKYQTFLEEAGSDLQFLSIADVDTYLYKLDYIFVFIIINQNHPLNDFDVNRLSYQYTDNGAITESHGPESVMYLIGQINQKKCRILPDYIEKLRSNTHEHDIVIRNKYLDQGWTITLRLPEIVLRPSDSIPISHLVTDIFKHYSR